MMINHAYQEYRDKLKELYGPEAHDHIVNAIMLDHREPTTIHCPGVFNEDSTLAFAETKIPEVTRTFYDEYSHRYFEASMTDVLQAEYHLNRNYVLRGCSSVNEFYQFLGLDDIDQGDDIGWFTCGGIEWLDFNHRITVLDDGMEVCIIEMVFEPTIDIYPDY